MRFCWCMLHLLTFLASFYKMTSMFMIVFICTNKVCQMWLLMNVLGGKESCEYEIWDNGGGGSDLLGSRGKELDFLCHLLIGHKGMDFNS